VETARAEEAALRRDPEDARSSIEAAGTDNAAQQRRHEKAKTVLARERATTAALRQTLEQAEQRIVAVENEKVAEVRGVHEQSASDLARERAAAARLTDALTTLQRLAAALSDVEGAPPIWKSRSKGKPRSVVISKMPGRQSTPHERQCRATAPPRGRIRRLRASAPRALHFVRRSNNPSSGSQSSKAGNWRKSVACRNSLPSDLARNERRSPGSPTPGRPSTGAGGCPGRRRGARR
jgi:hypothetical protein